MEGSIQNQNGATKTNWADLGDDQMSSNSSINNDKKVRGGDKRNTHIKEVDKSDSLTHTYCVTYYHDKIETTVTSAAAAIDEWIKNIYKDYQTKLDDLIVGLDVEWFRIGNTSRRADIAVLQLCVDRRCLIIQLAYTHDIPESLKDFLGNEKFIFCGAGIDADATKLLQNYGLKVARTQELGLLAAFKLRKTSTDYSRLQRAGLKVLAKDVLNKNLPKRNYIRLSNWEDEYLSDEQIEYACLDAYVSFKLGIDLIQNRPDPERSDPEEDPSEAESEVDEPLFAHTHEVDFHGEKITATVTNKASAVEQWINDVYSVHPTVVGLDIEWRRLGSTRNQVAVLQLCVGSRCLVFQILWGDDIPTKLDEFLGDKWLIFVGVGIDGDACKLWTDYELKVVNTTELGPLAAFKLTNTWKEYKESKFHKAGLQKLAGDILNKELTKDMALKLSNWENRSLSHEQVEYACLDAYVSYKLGDDLLRKPDHWHTDPDKPKKFFKGPSEAKKVEEGKTKQQQVPEKANGGKTNNAKEGKTTKQQVPQKANGSKTNGTNSKRSN